MDLVPSAVHHKARGRVSKSGVYGRSIGNRTDYSAGTAQDLKKVQPMRIVATLQIKAQIVFVTGCDKDVHVAATIAYGTDKLANSCRARRPNLKITTDRVSTC